MSAGSDDPAAQVIEYQWCETLQRFADLQPLLADTRLRVTATHAAGYLGLPSSEALRSWLDARQLPPFKRLRNWYYLVALLERSERGEAIACWALTRGENPAVYYKFARSVGGVPWTQLRKRGSTDAKRRALSLWAVQRGDLDDTAAAEAGRPAQR